MSKAILGTRAVTGLNVGTAPHLIQDHELTVSANGWTDEEGAWATADGPKVEYTGYSAISCFASGRMAGSDHSVWMDGNTLYDNGSSVGTITAGSDMTIKAIDDGFLIMGAAKTYLYDGTYVRELGTWQADYGSHPTIQRGKATTLTVASTTHGASSTTITTTAAHGLVTGNRAALVGLDNAGAILNDKSYVVTAVTATTFTVDVVITGTASTTGSVYRDAAGLNGEYNFYLVPTVELADGRVMLGRPRQFTLNGTTPADDWSGSTVTLDYDDIVYLDVRCYWDNQFEIDGVAGTDYWPGVRVYRTKSDGTDLYLEKAWRHGDSDLQYAASYYIVQGAWLGYYAGVPDVDLGAVYDVGLQDHDLPPVSSISEAIGQRLFFADGKNVHWSHLDGIEFWNDLSYVAMPDTITALGRVRDLVVMFSADRIWTMDMSSALPFIREIDTPVGTTFPNAMETVDAGLLFLREDGLWLFDGVRVENISRRAFSYLEDPKSVTAAGDTIYMSGEYYSFVARIRDGGWTWHSGDGVYEIADATSGYIYAASDTTISKLFAGGPVGGMLTTKLFGDLNETRQYRVVLDVEGESRPTVSINGVRQSDVGPHQEPTPTIDTGRRLIRIPIPRLSNPYFTMTLSTSGDLKVCGYWVEAE